MADLLPRCRRATWGAVSTPPRPFRDLPAALLHPRDHSFKGHTPSRLSIRTSRTTRTTRALAVLEQGRSPYNTRNGVGYRGPYLYGAYPGWLPFGYGLPFGLPFGDDDQDEGSAAQVPPQQPDDSNQPPADYGPEVAANSSVTLPAHLPGANRSRTGAWAARHHFDLQGWTSAGAGA